MILKLHLSIMLFDVMDIIGSVGKETFEVGSRTVVVKISYPPVFGIQLFKSINWIAEADLGLLQHTRWSAL